MEILIILLFTIINILLYLSINTKNIENYYALFNIVIIFLFYLIPYSITFVLGIISISIAGYIILRRVV